MTTSSFTLPPPLLFLLPTPLSLPFFSPSPSCLLFLFLFFFLTPPAPLPLSPPPHVVAVSTEDMADKLFKHFGPGTEYEKARLQSGYPIKGPWTNHNLKVLL